MLYIILALIHAWISGSPYLECAVPQAPYGLERCAKRKRCAFHSTATDCAWGAETDCAPQGVVVVAGR